MDKTTLDGILKMLPDASEYASDECYHYGSYLDRIQDKYINVRFVFKKDDSGKSWVYVETQNKVADS